MTKFEFIRSLTDEQMAALLENFVEKQISYFPNHATAFPYSPCDNCLHPTACEGCPHVKKLQITCNS